MVKMVKQILAVVAIITITLGIVSCTENRSYPVTEDGFPIGFMRTTDGTRVYLGMHKRDVERRLVEPDPFSSLPERTFYYFGYGEAGSSAMQFGFNKEDIVVLIAVYRAEEWIIVGGLHTGLTTEEQQNIFEYGELARFHRFYEDGVNAIEYLDVGIVDNLHNPRYLMEVSSSGYTILVGEPLPEFWERHGYPR